MLKSKQEQFIRVLKWVNEDFGMVHFFVFATQQGSFDKGFLRRMFEGVGEEEETVDRRRTLAAARGKPRPGIVFLALLLLPGMSLSCRENVKISCQIFVHPLGNLDEARLNRFQHKVFRASVGSRCQSTLLAANS